MTADQVRDLVACEGCGAERGEPCTPGPGYVVPGAAGQLAAGGVHGVRVLAAREALR